MDAENLEREILNCLQGILGSFEGVCTEDNNEREDQKRQTRDAGRVDALKGAGWCGLRGYA